MAMITSDQFDRTRRLALRLAGIELLDRHRELLDRRSRRLGICEEALSLAMALIEVFQSGNPSTGIIVSIRAIACTGSRCDGESPQCNST
jgi:hypothetical protein